MLVQMIELEEMQMDEISDDFMESITYTNVTDADGVYIASCLPG